MLDDLHVSLDIEACGEVLLSIGACTFNPRTGESLSEFYGVPSVGEQMQAGLRLDADAFAWWLRQDEEARAAIQTQDHASLVLHQFSEWVDRKAWVWAYPTSYDLSVIERVYRAFHKRVPWTWTKTMDGRTLWRLACANDSALERIEKEANPCPHHALADAKEQARWFAHYLPAVLAAKEADDGE